MKTTEEEFNQAMLEEFRAEEALQTAHEKKIKLQYRLKLKDLIHVDSLYEYLDQQWWAPMAIVNLKLTDDKMSGYADTQCARIEDEQDGLIYLKTETYGDDIEIKDVYYYYVWQQCHDEDSYSGFMLFPLSDGRFFKVSYSC